MEGGLGEQRQRVRLLLLHRGRLRPHGGWVGRPGPSLLIQGLARRGEGPHEEGADLGRQPSFDPPRAVLVGIDVQRAEGVLEGGLAGLGLAVHAAPAAHDAFDVLGRAGASDRQQLFLDLRSGDAGEGADLGVGELAMGQGLGQAWQGPQGAGDAHLLAGGAEVEADAPGEPGGTGAEAVIPAAAGVELADEVEQAGGGGLEVRGELGDLVAQAVELRHGLRGRGDSRRMNLHERPPFGEGTLHPGFGATWEARQATIVAGSAFLRDEPTAADHRASVTR